MLKWLERAEMAGTDWKLPEIAGKRRRKCLEITQNGWDGWKWLDMA